MSKSIRANFDIDSVLWNKFKKISKEVDHRTASSQLVFMIKNYIKEKGIQ